MKKIMIFKSRKDKISNIKDLEKKLTNIIGQIIPEQNYQLFVLARKLKKKSNIVEIGSFKGKSTIALGLGAKISGSRVYSIDPHDDFVGVAGGVFGPQDLKDKISAISKFDLGKYIFPICLPSDKVGRIWDKPIGLLWIDGDHSYESVKLDYDLFSKYIENKGYLIFHDCDMEGVTRCISEMDKKRFHEEKTIRSMKIFKVKAR